MDLAPVPSLWPNLVICVKGLLGSIILKPYLFGLVAALVVGGGYLAFGQGGGQANAQSTSVTQVQRRTIVSSVQATGKVTFASEQTLNFNTKGTVAKVNVKEGDHVKQGQILAELDKSSVLADVQSAQLAVGASALQLQQLQSDKQKTILDAQNALDQGQRQYQQAMNDMTVSKEKLPSDLAAAERTVQEKQTALDQAKLDLEKQKTTEIQSLAMTAQSTLTTAESLLDSFYGILTNAAEARPATGNYDLEIFNQISNDSTLKQQAKNAYFDAVNAAVKMHDAYGATLATQRDPEILVKALSDAHNLAKSVYALGENTYAAMQSAITDTNNYKVTDLASARAIVSSNRGKTADLINAIETAQANLSALSSDKDTSGIPSVTLQAKQNAVSTAQNALTQAQDSLKILQTQNPADLQKLADSIEQMKADLASKKAALQSTTTSTDVNIKLKKNDVAQKATSAKKAAKILEDYQLAAPFDGIVTHIDYKTGDNLLDTGDTENIVIQNHDFIVVTIPLDQVDVVRVSTGMPATIVFDAVAGQTFQGTIDAIDSTPVTTSGVVSYNVKIKLPTPEGLTILSGMTATVSIETMRKGNVLAVPNLALQNIGNITTVKTSDNRSVPVTTGATDGRYTEILSGLQQGQSIISTNVVVQTTGNSQNATQQLFRLGGGGFQGGGGGIRTGGGGGVAR